MKTRLKLIAAALALAASFAGTASYAKDDMVQIKGSDTLINMVQRLAEVYMAKTPGSYIAVTGGGSGTGIAGIVNKKCDIANSSRTIKPSEVEQANQKGIDPKRVVIAIDALSIVVSTKNPVSELSVDQIGRIYKGEIKNWSEVGGSDMPITLYGRQSNSGTYDFMKENVMYGEYSPRMKSMNGNAQIAEALNQDASGIGYVGVGYAKEATGIKVLNVSTKPGAKPYNPLNISDVKSGKYPITRPLNQYVDGAPKGAVRAFLEFELSAEGQQIVEKEGFFAIPEEYQVYNDQLLGRTGKIRTGPGTMRPADLDVNDGIG